MFHSTAIIHKKAKIAKDVTIGPYCIIEENVEIETGNNLISHVCVGGNTQIGKNNTFYPFSTIGLPPQDKKYKGEDSKLIIGDNNVFREHVTINPGTSSGGMITSIKNNCLVMVGSHIAHDCMIDSDVILVNNAILGGHVKINKGAIIGGNSAVHQFVNIGQYSMIGGMSGVESNIIPYGLYFGIRKNLRGLNLVGLKRQGISKTNIIKINKIFKKIFIKNEDIKTNINKLSNEERKISEINEIIEFILLNSKRGIAKYINA